MKGATEEYLHVLLERECISSGKEIESKEGLEQCVIDSLRYVYNDISITPMN